MPATHALIVAFDMAKFAQPPRCFIRAPRCFIRANLIQYPSPRRLTLLSGRCGLGSGDQKQMADSALNELRMMQASGK